MDLDARLREVFDEIPRRMVADVGEERLLELEGREPGRLEAVISDVVVKTTERTAQDVAERLKADGPAMLAYRRAAGRAFERDLARRWARPFALAEMAMVVAFELGEEFNEKHRPRAEQEDDLVFGVLIRLHARACRIAEEVMALLKAGFGQAALARWRALHEVAVVASFISEHGRQTAERYLLHEDIENWRAMQEFQARAERLGEEPFAERELREAEAAFDELIARYGKPYASPYGWAHEALSVGDAAVRGGRVTISAIERAVSLDHMRPYYRLASHGTHANPKGILFTPDLLEGHPEVLLAGPGFTGLADPGQCALISLNLVTATLVMSNPGESAPLVLMALKRLVDEACSAYVETESMVECGEGMPRYGLIARIRHHAVPRLARKPHRVRASVTRVASRARRAVTASR